MAAPSWNEIEESENRGEKSGNVKKIKMDDVAVDIDT